MLPLTSAAPTALPLPQAAPVPLNGTESKDPVAQARALREQFGQFFGETFYGQMIKSMRLSTDKPAYFHGGRAEEIFQGQLDQTLAQEMTAASADRLIGPMFEHAFPQAAQLLAQAERQPESTPGLEMLNQLQRR